MISWDSYKMQSQPQLFKCARLHRNMEWAKITLTKNGQQSNVFEKPQIDSTIILVLKCELLEFFTNLWRNSGKAVRNRNANAFAIFIRWTTLRNLDLGYLINSLEETKAGRLRIAAQNLARHRATHDHRNRFLHRIITGDEKWCLYANVKQRKQWICAGDTPTPRVRQDLHPEKIMLCVWWDWEGIVHWETLEKNKTRTF
ncbi:transposase, partial [Ostertagia ostertagi]